MWDGHGDFCSGDGASEPQDGSEGVERNKGEPGTNAIALLNPFLVLGFPGDVGGGVWAVEVEFGGCGRRSLGRRGGVWAVEVEFGAWEAEFGAWEAEFGSSPGAAVGKRSQSCLIVRLWALRAPRIVPPLHFQ